MADKAAQCRNCHWWRDPASGDRLARAVDDGEVGECRRHAPQVVAFPDQRTNRWATRTSWPSTLANHGCGDFSSGGPASSAPAAAAGPGEGPDGMIHKAMSRRMGDASPAALKPAPAPRPALSKEMDEAGRLAAAAAAKAAERSAPVRAEAPRRGPSLPSGDLDVAAPPTPEPQRKRGPALPTGDLNVSAPPEPPKPKPIPQKPRPPLEEDTDDPVAAMLGEEIAPTAPAPGAAAPFGAGADMLARVSADMASAKWKNAAARLPKGGGHDIAGLEGWRQSLAAFRAGPPQPITHVPAGQRDAADDVGYFAYGKLKAPIIVAPDTVVKGEAEARDWLHAALVHAAQERGRTLPGPVRRDYGLE